MSGTGHIPTPEGGAMDIYVDGERAEFRDGYREGAEVVHRHEDGVLSVFVTGEERLGITNVSGEYWDDSGEAFDADGDVVNFEHRHTDGDSPLVFEAEGDYSYTVEIRSVGDGSGTGQSNDRGLYEKYDVQGEHGEPVRGAFVLEPADDPAAREAIRTYAAETDNDALADDLRDWVNRYLPAGDADD